MIEMNLFCSFQVVLSSNINTWHYIENEKYLNSGRMEVKVVINLIRL